MDDNVHLEYNDGIKSKPFIYERFEPLQDLDSIRFILDNYITEKDQELVLLFYCRVNQTRIAEKYGFANAQPNVSIKLRNIFNKIRFCYEWRHLKEDNLIKIIDDNLELFNICKSETKHFKLIIILFFYGTSFSEIGRKVHISHELVSYRVKKYYSVLKSIAEFKPFIEYFKLLLKKKVRRRKHHKKTEIRRDVFKRRFNYEKLRSRYTNV